MTWVVPATTACPRKLALALGLLALCVLVLPFVAKPGDVPRRSSRAVCPAPGPGRAACHVMVATNAQGVPITGVAAMGYSPRQLKTAYGLLSSSSSSGAGQTIAIVVGYDDPTAASDLAVFSRTFGLPSCTPANGCFKKVDQRGGRFLPKVSARWAVETSTDVQTAHGICPKCRLLLVEADSDELADLLTAEDYATEHATVVSNSWGAAEFAGESLDDSHFLRPGVRIVFSAGDHGYGAQYPAASPNVIAVGGTTLTLRLDDTRRRETAWSGGGSGCSSFEAKPAWQHDSGCSHRTIADTAAVADPATGAAIFDSTPYCDSECSRGWYRLGGTSLSSPIVAAVLALARPPGQAAPIGAATLYAAQRSIPLFDVTSRGTGTCEPRYLCTAGPGYDGPTGVGTPKGTSGF